MRIRIGNENDLMPKATFATNYMIYRLLWGVLEKAIYGEVRPSVVDAIMLIIFCLTITWSYMKIEELGGKW